MESGEYLLDDLIACLGESVDRVRALRERNGYLPEPGSRAYNEWVFIQRDNAHPFDSLSVFAYDFAAAQLAAAEDHLQAVTNLLLEGTATVAPFVLARAAIEAGGRAVIFLNPKLPIHDRSALVHAERLHELRQLRRLMLAHDPHGESARVATDIQKVEEDMAAIEAHATEHGVGIPERPSFTQAFRSALAADDGRDHLAALAMAAYSSVAHAVADMLVAHTLDRDEEGPAWQPFQVGLAELEDKFVFDLMVALVIAYSRPVQLQIQAYGWPPSSWERWLAHVRRRIRETQSWIRAHGRGGPP